MKSKRFFVTLIIVLIGFVIISACSSNQDETPNHSAGGNNESQTPSGDSNNQEENTSSEETAYEIPEGTTIEIVNGGGTQEEQFNAAMGNKIREAFPHINLVYTPITSEVRLEHLIVSGKKFDLYMRSIGSFFYEVPVYDFQYDLTDLARKHNVDLSSIEPSIIDSMRNNSNGEIWGIPTSNSTMVVYYNKDIFDRFGIDYPQDGLTWDEYIDLSNSLNREQDGEQYVGMALSGHHVIKLNNFGLPYVDPETELSTYDNPQWESLLRPFTVLGQHPGYRAFMEAKDNKIPDSNDFYEGRAAMLGTILHHIGHPTFTDPNFNWDMASFPTYADNPGIGAQSYPNFISIPSFAENKDAAMQIIKYLVSEEFQMEASRRGEMTILTNDDIQSAYGSDSVSDKNVTAVFHNQFAPIMYKTAYDNDVERAITQFTNDLALGNIDINTALSRAKEEGDLKIAELQR